MRVLGHRGSPGFPRFGENTRSSFEKALAAGAEGFELDVRRAGDGTLVVIHDATLDRTTNGAGRVSALSYQQICRFDAGHGDTVPRLVDVLDEFGGRCLINIELKEKGLAEEVCQLVDARHLRSSIVVSAFDADEGGETSWSELERIARAVPIALLATRRKIVAYQGDEGYIQAALRSSAAALHPARDAASASLVRMASEANLVVRVWTINNTDEVCYWRDAGAEAIISDFPERCVNLLRADCGGRRDG